MSTEPDSPPNRLETVVALLIAVVTVVGALIAWRASVADDGAGDADFAGLRASLAAEETRALNAVDAYEHYGAYTNYWRYRALGDELADALQSAAPEALDALDRQRAEAYDLADANQDLFPNRFLNRDGTYSVARETGEAWADAAREQDLNPEPQYAAADKLRARSSQLLGTLTLLGLALVGYTLVEAADGRLKLLLAGGSTLLALVAVALAVLLEVAR
ncbi:MAG: hypothetical protein IT317_13125 [Anaerolineales bacterium]|nr:hypothetical protein [Anaerolineales bacterium]